MNEKVEMPAPLPPLTSDRDGGPDGAYYETVVPPVPESGLDRASAPASADMDTQSPPDSDRQERPPGPPSQPEPDQEAESADQPEQPPVHEEPEAPKASPSNPVGFLMTASLALKQLSERMAASSDWFAQAAGVQGADDRDEPFEEYLRMRLSISRFCDANDLIALAWLEVFPCSDSTFQPVGDGRSFVLKETGEIVSLRTDI